MLNFAPTQEQEEVRRLAHSIAVEQLRPQARSAEKRGDISLELMHTLMQTGLTTPFPEALGGSGTIEAVTYALIAEELGFGRWVSHEYPRLADWAADRSAGRRREPAGALYYSLR